MCLMQSCPASLSYSGCYLPQQARILPRFKGMWAARSMLGAHGGIMTSGLVFCMLHRLLSCLGCVSFVASTTDRSCALAAVVLATAVVATKCWHCYRCVGVGGSALKGFYYHFSVVLCMSSLLAISFSSHATCFSVVVAGGCAPDMFFHS